MLRRTVGLAVVALLAMGCAGPVSTDPGGPTAGTTPTPSTTTDGRLVGSGIVIDEGSGPWLCFGVRQSLPPQCAGGVELRGWQWPDQGVEREGRTTWGDFAVVGTYDGKRLAAEKTVDPAAVPPPAEEERDFSTPCPEPAGGWRAPDPARATPRAQDQALRRAERLPGYADAWVDVRETPANPRTTVLNISFTRDLEGAERALRTVWGGPLCVSKGERTHAKLKKVRDELNDTPEMLSNGFGFGHVDLSVVHDDGTLQRRLDETYGAGLVRVTSALQPYTE